MGVGTFVIGLIHTSSLFSSLPTRRSNFSLFHKVQESDYAEISQIYCEKIFETFQLFLNNLDTIVNIEIH